MSTDRNTKTSPAAPAPSSTSDGMNYRIASYPVPNDEKQGWPDSIQLWRLHDGFTRNYVPKDAPAPSSSGAPAPADSQREAAIEAAIDTAPSRSLLVALEMIDKLRAHCASAFWWAKKLATTAPPAPVAPVTDGVPPDLAAALAWWGDGTEPKTMAEAVEKARSYRNDAHELADVSFELRNQPEGNPAEQVRRLLAPVTDAEVEAAIRNVEAMSSLLAREDGGAERKRYAKLVFNADVALRALIARRVAEAEARAEALSLCAGTTAKTWKALADARQEEIVRVRAEADRRVAEERGAGLRELRARLVDFCRIRDRGYDVRSDFSPLWVLDEIDKLLAAPPASKLAEEPAQEGDGPCLSALLANMRMEMSDGANGMRTPREEAIAAVVECVARRIEALENNKEARK